MPAGRLHLPVDVLASMWMSDHFSSSHLPSRFHATPLSTGCSQNSSNKPYHFLRQPENCHVQIDRPSFVGCHDTKDHAAGDNPMHICLGKALPTFEFRNMLSFDKAAIERVTRYVR